MSEILLSRLAELLSSFAQTVLSGVSRHVKRLSAERSAALAPVGGNVRLLDQIFDDTLGRLCGGKIDDAWWKALLDRFEQPLVAPEFLRQTALQDWLRDNQARADLKTLARARFLPARGDEDAAADRLSEAYSRATGEDPRLARGPIEVVKAVLVAGYETSLDSQRPLAALLQASVEGIHDRFDALAPRLVSPSLIELISGEGRAALRPILLRRTLDPSRSRAEIKILLGSFGKDGKLGLAGPAVHAEVLYWAARLHATQPETLADSIEYLDRLRELAPTADTRVVDAWVFASQGDIDAALRTVREIDTPDGRANLFALLRHARGVDEALGWLAEQPRRGDPNFLTGAGWHNAAVSLTLAGRWDDALESVSGAHVHVEEFPVLELLVGLLHATMLLPSPVRREAFHSGPHLVGALAVEGVDADRHREQALRSLASASRRLEPLGFTKEVQHARLVSLWLRLTDLRPEVAEEARREVTEGLADGERGVPLLPLLLRFDFAFDHSPVRQHLARQKRFGGLKPEEAIGEFFLALRTLPPKELADFIEREESRFASVVQPSSLAGSHIEALAKDGQFDRARSILEGRKSVLSESEYKLFRTLIDAHAGEDVRSQAEELYRDSGELTHLHTLVNVLGGSRDWVALRPRLEELFQLVRTTGNAERLVECLRRLPTEEDAAIVSLLEANPYLVARSHRLAEAQAWSLFHLGHWREADAINQRLLKDRGAAPDLLLDTNVALQAGDWERFPVIVEREWSRREQHDPGVLMRLAGLAAESGSPDRAMALARLAAEKAPDDPLVLIGASSLTFQLGREEEADPTWLVRAAALSSDTGPVRQVNLRTVVEEMIPAHRERSEKVERGLVEGEIPLHFASAVLNVALSNILLELPQRNAAELDGRRRTVIPVFSGARSTVDVHPEWTIGLDATSVLLLSHLGLLSLAIKTIQRVALVPETMPFLLNERRRALFHQPSRVKKAEEVLGQIAHGRLRLAEVSTEPPEWLVEEVGRDLAQLLETAKTSGGWVVHPLPIHKMRSFQEEKADLREYSGAVLTTVAFARTLHERGRLESAAHDRARGYLMANDRDQEGRTFGLGSPFFLDDLALTYLQDAGLLPSICAEDLDLRVHPSTRTEQEALIDANRQGDRLAAALDAVRRTLRDAIACGKAIFLQHRSAQPNGQEVDWPAVPGLRVFLEDVAPCDAVCVDDRSLNRNPTLTDRKRRVVPVLSTLDVLRFLEVQGAITPTEKEEKLHRLRVGSFGLVPIDAGELGASGGSLGGRRATPGERRDEGDPAVAAAAPKPRHGPAALGDTVPRQVAARSCAGPLQALGGRRRFRGPRRGPERLALPLRRPLTLGLGAHRPGAPRIAAAAGSIRGASVAAPSGWDRGRGTPQGGPSGVDGGLRLGAPPPRQPPTPRCHGGVPEERADEAAQ